VRPIKLYVVVFLLALTMLGPGLISASADTFTLSGTFTDGSTLSGTIVIDTVAGTVDSGDPITSAPDSGSYPFLYTQGTVSSVYYAQFGTTSLFSFPFVDLVFPTTSLVGYTGGNLCSVDNPCTYTDSTLDLVTATLGLQSGTSAAPEPATFVLLSMGLISLGWMRKRRCQSLTDANQLA